METRGLVEIIEVRDPPPPVPDTPERRRARRRARLVWWAVLVTLTVGGVWFVRNLKPFQLYPSSFQLIEVSPEPTATCTDPVLHVNGRTYYRAAGCGLDLGDIVLTTLKTAPAMESWVIIFNIKSSSSQRFDAWCDARRGKWMGVLADGRLLDRFWIGGAVGSSIGLGNLRSKEEADELAAWLRRGGSYGPSGIAATQPAK